MAPQHGQADGSRPDGSWPKLAPIETGIRGHCPRCGEGHLFVGFLKLGKECEICGLSYDFADPADGPAFFVICFACIPAVAFALWLQIHFSPPFWVHLVTTLPMTVATCILPLRPLKGWLVCSQFFFKAGEVRMAVSPSCQASSPTSSQRAASPSIPPDGTPE